MTIVQELGPQLQLCCPACKTRPNRYYIDIYTSNLGKVKIYSSRAGAKFSSWDVVYRELTTIRTEIDREVFDPRDYLPERKNNFSFDIQIDKWLSDKEKKAERNALAPSYTKELKRYVNNHYKPFFNKKKNSDVRELRTGDIEDFYHSLPVHLSEKTVKNIVTCLQNFFSELFRKEVIKRCPQFPKISPPDPEWCWIDEDTQNALISVIPEKHRPIYIFMARQAVRPGEARALHWEDIDFEKGIVTIRRTYSLDKLRTLTKSKRVRYLPIHPSVLDTLNKMRGISGLVFRNGKNPYSASVLWYHWEAAKSQLVKEERLSAEAAKKLRLYDGTRHSVASQAVNRGVDLNLIGKVLGHSKNDMTKRYAHVMTETLRKVIEAPERPQEEDSENKVLNLKRNSES